jgi:hypothetical protein
VDAFPDTGSRRVPRLVWGDEAGVLVVDQGFVDGFPGLVHSGARLS